jgi:hypothetical protein
LVFFESKFDVSRFEGFVTIAFEISADLNYLGPVERLVAFLVFWKVLVLVAGVVGGLFNVKSSVRPGKLATVY